MNAGIITGILTVIVLVGILIWLYSIGKDYKPKK